METRSDSDLQRRGYIKFQQKRSENSGIYILLKHVKKATIAVEDDNTAYTTMTIVFKWYHGYAYNSKGVAKTKNSRKSLRTEQYFCIS
jgi:hypothetical protein